jgi:hypothetical protein
VDLVAESLVSWMVIIEGGLWGVVIKSCKHGMEVLSEEAFHVIACVAWLVSGSGLVEGGCVVPGGVLDGCIQVRIRYILMPLRGVVVVGMGMRHSDFECLWCLG